MFFIFIRKTTILSVVYLIHFPSMVSGVPAVVDFAAMRDAVTRLGGSADSINPVCPADLVVDHSIQVDQARRYVVYDVVGGAPFVSDVLVFSIAE